MEGQSDADGIQRHERMARPSKEKVRPGPGLTSDLFHMLLPTPPSLSPSYRPPTADRRPPHHNHSSLSSPSPNEAKLSVSTFPRPFVSFSNSSLMIRSWPGSIRATWIEKLQGREKSMADR